MELLPDSPDSCWELTKGGWGFDEQTNSEKYIKDKYFGIFESNDGSEFECKNMDSLLDAAFALVVWWKNKNP